MMVIGAAGWLTRQRGDFLRAAQLVNVAAELTDKQSTLAFILESAADLIVLHQPVRSGRQGLVPAAVGWDRPYWAARDLHASSAVTSGPDASNELQSLASDAARREPDDSPWTAAQWMAAMRLPPMRVAFAGIAAFGFTREQLQDLDIYQLLHPSDRHVLATAMFGFRLELHRLGWPRMWPGTPAILYPIACQFSLSSPDRSTWATTQQPGVSERFAHFYACATAGATHTTRAASAVWTILGQQSRGRPPRSQDASASLLAHTPASHVSPAFRKLYSDLTDRPGTSHGQARVDFTLAVPQPRQGALLEPLEPRSSRAPSQDVHVRLRDANGEYRWVNVMHRVSPGAGQVCVYRDVTERRRVAELALRLRVAGVEREQAARTSVLRHAYMAGAFHALQSPSVQLESGLQLLQHIGAGQPAELAHSRLLAAISQLSAAQNTLATTMDDITTVAAVEAGRLRVHGSAELLPAALPQPAVLSLPSGSGIPSIVYVPAIGALRSAPVCCDLQRLRQAARGLLQYVLTAVPAVPTITFGYARVPQRLAAAAAPSRGSSYAALRACPTLDASTQEVLAFREAAGVPPARAHDMAAVHLQAGNSKAAGLFAAQLRAHCTCQCRSAALLASQPSASSPLHLRPQLSTATLALRDPHASASSALTDWLRVFTWRAGAGMSQDAVQELFEPQSADSPFGLTVARAAAVAMHGSMGVVSAPGMGMLIYIDIPVHAGHVGHVTPASSHIAAPVDEPQPAADAARQPTAMLAGMSTQSVSPVACDPGQTASESRISTPNAGHRGSIVLASDLSSEGL